MNPMPYDTCIVSKAHGTKNAEIGLSFLNAAAVAVAANAP